MNLVVHQRRTTIPLRTACEALALNRSSVYSRRQRRRRTEPAVARTARKAAPQPRALSATERERVHALMNSEEFCNQPPAEIYQSMLERGEYHAPYPARTR